MATILYIEDNVSIRQLVRLVLSRRGDIQLLDTETGGEGLTLAFSRRPDLVLIDITLPDMDGGDVLRQLRENPDTAQTPSIAISGNTVSETRKTFPGFQDYLEKPIDFQRLSAAIDTLTA